MQLYVYSPQMEMLGVIEEITSLLWTRKHWEPGEFKLLVPFNDTHNQLLKEDNLIIKHGDTEAAEIKFVDISKNLEGFEVIEVQGKFITQWISKRLIVKQLVNVLATAQNHIRRIVDENCITTSAKRQLPNLSLADDMTIEGEEILYTSEILDNALDAITDLAQGSKIGYRVNTDRSTGLHTFSTYKGVDCTENNSAGNPPCIFSQEYDNVLGQEYTKSTEKYRNTAYVTGETREDESFETVIVNDENAGLNRNELYVSGGDIKQTYTDENDKEVTMSFDEYCRALRDRGAEKLKQYPISQSFSSRINVGANLVYRKDFDLGDRVTCFNKKWNVRIDARITEVTEGYEVKGESLEIVFGEAIPSLYKQIKTMTGG